MEAVGNESIPIRKSRKHHVQFCSAINCNNNRFSNPDLSFFRFPLEEERSQRWVINCRREDLKSKTVKQLFNGNVLCSQHFEDIQFLSPGGKRNRLKPKIAIPTIFNVPNPPKLISPSRPVPKVRETRVIDSNVDASGNEETTPVSDTAEPIPFNTDYVKLLKRKIYAQAKRIKRLKAAPVKQVSAKKEVQEIKDKSAKYLNQETHAFFCTQLDQSITNRRRWTHRDKAYALSLYHSSPCTYQLMQKSFFLPSKITLRRLLRNIEVYPGFSERIADAFKTKVVTMTAEEKLCVLVFDEMALKQNLTYNIERDYVEGLENFGDGREDNSNKHANSSLVFMARGLIHKWKQPFGYVVSNSTVKVTTLKDLTQKAISVLFSVGLNVKAVVCDQGTNNQSMVKALGATTDNPYFMHGSTKILVFFDPPHLLKNIRNNLLRYNFFTDDGEASWSVVKQFYEKDKENPLSTMRMAPRLTNDHIVLPPFGKLRVSYAAQVLSHSVAKGIFTMCRVNMLPKDTCMETANFISLFNDLFDTFNSCGSTSKSTASFKHGITPTSSHIDFLKTTRVWLESLRYGESKKLAHAYLPCIRGWIGNINALLALVDDLFSSFPSLDFILTNRLNQDCVENLFSVIRGKNGHMSNPDPQQFRLTLRQVMVDKILLTSKGSNCTDDLDSFLFNMCSKTTNSSSFTLLDRVPQSNDSKQTTNILKSCQMGHILHLENILAYVGGFIIKKLEKRLCCACFNSIQDPLSSGQRFHQLIEEKQFSNCANGGLKKPTESFVALVEAFEVTFMSSFWGVAVRKGIRRILKDKMINSAATSKLTLNDIGCCEIDSQVADIFITVRIYHELKLRTEQSSKEGKLKRKLKTIQHQ